MHGGKSLVAAALPQFRHGRYSKHLPERLLERYQEAAADPELLAARDELALIDARIADLLTRVDTGESGGRWKAVQAAFKAWRKAPLGEQAAREEELEEAINAGASDYQAWSELFVALAERRKTGEFEKKRLVDMQQMLTAEEAIGQMKLMVDIVKRHVTDPLTLQGIAGDLKREVLERGN